MSPQVRAWFIEKIGVYASTAPFQETDGGLRTQKGLPEMWTTLESDPGSTQRLTIGVPWLEREYGTATVIFLVKSGKGPSPVLWVAKAFKDALQALYQEEIQETDTRIVGTVRVENVSPPNGEPYEEGNWLVCSVACVYSYDSWRGVAS
jgi:hypothetical protein